MSDPKRPIKATVGDVTTTVDDLAAEQIRRLAHASGCEPEELAAELLKIGLATLQQRLTLAAVARLPDPPPEAN